VANPYPILAGGSDTDLPGTLSDPVTARPTLHHTELATISSVQALSDRWWTLNRGSEVTNQQGHRVSGAVYRNSAFESPVGLTTRSRLMGKGGSL